MFELIFNLFNFNGMNKENNNIDKLLETKIKEVLYSNTSDTFSDEVMKRVNISIEFAEEDKKTFRLAKSIVAGIVSSLMIFVSLLIFYFIKNPEENNPDVNNTITSMYEYISQLSSKILSIFGISGTIESFLIFIIISAIIIFFLVMEKRFLNNKISN